MDSFEFNKIAGATLASTIALLGLSIVTDSAFTPKMPEKPGYIIEVPETEVADAPAAEAERPIEFFLASATAERGEAVFKKCSACHNAAPGGSNGIGPNLHSIVGAPAASRGGFSYSDALAAIKGQNWSWNELSAWLANPKAYAAGNKMSFAGLKKPEERAAVMVWLNQQSANPLPLPEAPTEAPVEAAAPVETAAEEAAETVTG